MSDTLAYRLADAARVSGLSQRTLQRAIKDGSLAAKKSAKTADGDPAGTLLILASELTSWLEHLPDA